MNKKILGTVFAVLVVMVLAFGFRFYDIQNFPPGLFPDEAANGEDALLILDGDWRPFYPRGNGREGLYFFLEAISIKFFGIGVWQLHIVSALIGSLTVLAVYFATRVWFGRMAGILAGLFLATNHWHTTMSRTGFRAILIPLFVALFTAFVGYVVVKRGKQEKRGKRGKLDVTMSYVYAGLAGAAFAGGFYTYIAYRVMVGVIVGMAFILMLAALHPKVSWPQMKRYWKHIVVGALAGLLVFLPLLWFFIQEPDAFVGRAGQVSVFSPNLQEEYGGGTLLGTILYSTRETLLSFFAPPGDLNWRHNVAEYPLLNPLVAVMFLLGLFWAIRGLVQVGKKIWQGKELHLDLIFPYLLLVLAGMIVPVITTAEGMPHGLRSVGLVVPIFMLAGVAGAVAIRWILKRFKADTLKPVLFGVVAGALLLGVVYDGTVYFLFARKTADAHYAYRADLTEVAEYLNSKAGEVSKASPVAPPLAEAMGDKSEASGLTTRPYLVLDEFSLQTVHFLTSVASHDHTVGDETHPDEAEHKWIQLNPATSHLTQVRSGEIIIFTQSTFPDADRYLQYHNNVELVESRVNWFGQEIMRVYRGVGGGAEEVLPEGVGGALDA